MKQDDWFQTATGKALPLPGFTPDDFYIEDIAHGLALQCRFSGHCRTFYSLAEHSHRIARLVGPCEDQLWALLHDAAEAYLSDIPAPFKRLLPEFKALEKKFMQAICARFGLPEEEPEAVKRADLVMLATEKRDLLVLEPQEWGCLEGVVPDSTKIEPWIWQMAEQRFLEEFYRLRKLRGEA